MMWHGLFRPVYIKYGMLVAASQMISQVKGGNCTGNNCPETPSITRAYNFYLLLSSPCRMPSGSLGGQTARITQGEAGRKSPIRRVGGARKSGASAGTRGSSRKNCGALLRATARTRTSLKKSRELRGPFTSPAIRQRRAIKWSRSSVDRREDGA